MEKQPKGIFTSILENFGDYWPIYITGGLLGAYALNHQKSMASMRDRITVKHEKEYEIGTRMLKAADLNKDGDIDREEMQKVLKAAGYEGTIDDRTMFEVYDPELVKDFDFTPLYDFKGVERRGNTVYIPVAVAQGVLEKMLR